MTKKEMKNCFCEQMMCMNDEKRRARRAKKKRQETK
jgi:hypothetical protein